MYALKVLITRTKQAFLSGRKPRLLSTPQDEMHYPSSDLSYDPRLLNRDYVSIPQTLAEYPLRSVCRYRGKSSEWMRCGPGLRGAHSPVGETDVEQTVINLHDLTAGCYPTEQSPSAPSPPLPSMPYSRMAPCWRR